VPIVAITCDHETINDRRGIPAPRYVSPQAYADAVLSAGGDPVFLPYTPEDRVSRVLDFADALVLSGGDFDVPPDYYGEEPHPKLGRIVRARSDFERALLLGALRRDTPVLAVCGGMQLLNALRGGTLVQDLSLRPNTQVHEQPNNRAEPSHPVTVKEGSRLAQLTGKDQLEVNSTHHQVLGHVAPDLKASAVAPDGVVEAIEDPGRRFVLGIQWHPELLGTPVQLRLYEGLVDAASRR